MTRRRRSFLLLGLALVLGGLAASDVASREAALERRLGPLTPVVVTRSALAEGRPIDPRALTVRTVPARFAPRDSFAAVADVAGRRTAAPIPAGADVTSAALHDPATDAPIRRGERVADVTATGPAQLVTPGARVDVLVTRESRPGRQGRTTLALEAVEVLAAAPSEGRVRASLRVTLRQAVYLAAAQSFARELRLLPRAAGDEGRSEQAISYDDALG